MIILVALVVVGAVLYLHHRFTSGGDGPDTVTEAAQSGESECCGMHVTCERDSLLSAVSAEIVYYDDEELDVYAGRPSESYTEAETEQFRDVLLTLLPHDIAGWARSIQLRGIELPAEVRDELLLIVAEARSAAARHS